MDTNNFSSSVSFELASLAEVQVPVPGRLLWSVMSRLVNAGFTELTVIDKIHQAYGVNLSVSSVLAKMQRDKRNGGNPSLAI
jgi:hypothetical protein